MAKNYSINMGDGPPRPGSRDRERDSRTAAQASERSNLRIERECYWRSGFRSNQAKASQNVRGRPGGLTAMKTIFRLSTPLVVLAVMLSMNAPAQGKGARGLATITGTVRDSKGMPLAGAVIQLIREGANQL